MQENYVYPIKIKKKDGILSIEAPDFPGQMTEAENEADAIKAAQEMIALCILDNENLGKDNPIPTEDKKIIVKDDEKLMYVHLWMPFFRNKCKEMYVKKTLTIPKWLDTLAKDNNVNFSAVLVKGLKKELEAY